MATVNIRISVSDPVAASATFEVIRVLRSRTVAAGPYEFTTEDSAVAATLLAPTTGPYAVVGRTLSLLIDSNPQLDVVFTGTDPLTAAEVATQIDTAAGAAIAVDDGNGALKLTSTNTGTASKIEIVAGSAESLFGLTAGDRDAGEDANIALVDGQNLYLYADNDGELAFFYKTQFFNKSTGLSSLESEPFLGGPGAILETSELSVAKIDLVDASGVAVPDQEITFYSVHEPLQIDGFTIALERAPVAMVTNNFGHAEITLVRGVKVRVVFEGTSVIREFTVPSVAEFDLLSVLSSAVDPFDVLQPAFPFAPRRTT